MKKIAVFVIAAVFVSSCSFFEKTSMTQDEIDAMTTQNIELQEKLIAAEHEANVQKMKANECANMLNELEKTTDQEMASGNFHVITGSFKTPAYADDYAEQIREMGGTGFIVNGPSDFSLVAFSSHNSLREAINTMEQTRINVSSEAWVYMER